MKRWQWSAPSQACFQRFALDQLHRVKALTITLPRPVIKNGGYVRVPKPRGGASFAQKRSRASGCLAMQVLMTFSATSFPKIVSKALKVMPIPPRPNSTGVPSR